MFYVKEKISDSMEIRVELNDENIFTACPVCGNEFNVDREMMADVLTDGDFYGTSIYCESCSACLPRDKED